MSLLCITAYRDKLSLVGCLTRWERITCRHIRKKCHCYSQNIIIIQTLVFDVEAACLVAWCARSSNFFLPSTRTILMLRDSDYKQTKTQSRITNCPSFALRENINLFERYNTVGGNTLWLIHTFITVQSRRITSHYGKKSSRDVAVIWRDG